IPGLQTPAVRSDRDSAWGQYTVFVERRAQVQASLKDAGMPTAVHYPRPLHHQPPYAVAGAPETCPESVRAAERVMSLPMSADLTEADQDRVVAAMQRALAT